MYIFIFYKLTICRYKILLFINVSIGIKFRLDIFYRKIFLIFIETNEDKLSFQTFSLKIQK